MLIGYEAACADVEIEAHMMQLCIWRHAPPHDVLGKGGLHKIGLHLTCSEPSHTSFLEGKRQLISSLDILPRAKSHA